MAAPAEPLTQHELDDFVDERVSDNYRLLSNLLEELKSGREQLLLRLSGGGGGGTDTRSSEWERVAADVRSTTSQLEALQSSVTTLLHGNGEKEAESLIRPQSVAAAKDIQQPISDLVLGRRLRRYLVWVRRVVQLSSKIDNAVSVGALSEAVEGFQELYALSNELAGSKCVQLLSFVGYWCEQRRLQLKERLTRVFSELLKAMGWPLVGTLSSTAMLAQQHKKTEFMSCFKQLLALVSPHHFTLTGEGVPKLSDPLLLPMEQLLAPLRKRFRFHFYGNVKTNSPDKPEWFFTQVSTWITSHAHFLESHIQPALQDTAFKHVDAKSEFIRGLLQEVDKRIHDSISTVWGSSSNQSLIDDDYLMSHLVDELLLFEQELRNVHCYPAILPSCVEGLLQEAPLCRWLNLEKQFAVEKLKSIIESPTAWQPRYAAVLEEDETKVPECAEYLMNLISGITDRYRLIPVLLPRLRFLELQSDLLLEFHQDLTSTVTIQASSPLSQQYIAYLNASHYITTVLQGWGEQTFFLELNYYSQHISSSSSLEAVEQLEALRKLDPEFADLEGTAFDTVIAGFSSLTSDMLRTLSRQIVTNLETELRPYQNNKWHNLPAVKDSHHEVSSSLLRVLKSLQEQLLFLTSHLSLLLLPHLISELCVMIDDLIFTKVVMTNHFTVGGASQLNFDLTKAVIPVLHQHTDMETKTILRRSLDASHLLQQLPGSLELLSGYLRSALSGDEEACLLATDTLQDMSVYSLSLDEAHAVIKLKITN